MNFRNLFLALLFLSLSEVALSQKIDNMSNVIRDPRIDQLVEKHRQYNLVNPGVDGFRVQIFFDSGNNSKRAAQTVRERFMEAYPNVAAYLTFNAPYYRVRVGDFRTRLEAEGFLYQLATSFPNAFTVPDRIQIDNKSE